MPCNILQNQFQATCITCLYLGGEVSDMFDELNYHFFFCYTPRWFPDHRSNSLVLLPRCFIVMGLSPFCVLASSLLRSHQVYPEVLESPHLWKHQIHRVQLHDHFEAINHYQCYMLTDQSLLKGENHLINQYCLWTNNVCHMTHLISGDTPATWSFHQHSVSNSVH